MSPTSIRYSSPEDRSVSMPFRYLERFRRRGNYGRKVLRLLGEQASWTSFLSHMWADKHLRAKRQCSSDYRLPLCFPNPSVQLRLMHQLRIFYFLRRTDNRLATQPGSFGRVENRL